MWAPPRLGSLKIPPGLVQGPFPSLASLSPCFSHQILTFVYRYNFEKGINLLTKILLFKSIESKIITSGHFFSHLSQKCAVPTNSEIGNKNSLSPMCNSHLPNHRFHQVFNWRNQGLPNTKSFPHFLLGTSHLLPILKPQDSVVPFYRMGN